MKFQAEYAVAVALVILILFGVVYLVLPRGPPESPHGVLTGQVTIGPLCPVEPCTVPDMLVMEAYSARGVIIRDQASGTLVESVVPEPGKDYSVSLPPGTYVVDINHIGIDRSPDVPATVTITRDTTTRLDISIDTGIR
ncbi:MAG: hypothetical protein LUO87_04945 [Methanomicrobiales archaeon]|nr:hypothetical protein [Methanomicrobiales archaeon]